MISKTSTVRAIKHLVAFGDTDIFPRLPEIEFLRDKADQIAAIMEKMQPGQISTSSALELLVPKNSRSFRIAHQLDVFDSLAFLSSVIEVATDLEKMRVAPEEGAAFSYRFAEGEGPRLFAVGGSFHDWMMKISEFGGEVASDDKRTVIETDISDFYQRIYHHRLENALDNATNKKAASIVKKIFKKIRGNQSFGLPVGQTASRILAEISLNDTDSFLIQEGVAHTRYVDDFRIIVENQVIAHGTLCKLAEQLMVAEGLSLNGEKTKITSLKEAQNEAKKRVEDVFNNADMKKFENYLKLTYEDDPTNDEEDEDAADLIFFDGNDLINRIVEIDEYGPKDISVFKALLKAIKLSEGATVDQLLTIPDRFLYLIPRDYCRAFYNLTDLTQEESEKLRNFFINRLNSVPYRDLTVCRYWILDLFVRGVLPCDWNDFRDYNFSRSIPEKRAEYFIRGRLGQHHWFRARKTQFAALSDWEKSAFAIGATCMPQDEYEKWVTAYKGSLPGPFADLLADWLKALWGRMTDVINPQA